MKDSPTWLWAARLYISSGLWSETTLRTNSGSHLSPCTTENLLCPSTVSSLDMLFEDDLLEIPVTSYPLPRRISER